MQNMPLDDNYGFCVLKEIIRTGGVPAAAAEICGGGEHCEYAISLGPEVVNGSMNIWFRGKESQHGVWKKYNPMRMEYYVHRNLTEAEDKLFNLIIAYRKEDPRFADRRSGYPYLVQMAEQQDPLARHQNQLRFFDAEIREAAGLSPELAVAPALTPGR